MSAKPRLLISLHTLDELVAARNFEGALYKIGERDRLLLVWSWFQVGMLDDDELRSVLAEAWSGVDDPLDSTCPDPQGRWLELFERAGYVSDTDERLTGTLAVFRGVGGRTRRRGFSWTLDIEKARWFARRSGARYGNPLLYEATIEAADVLAFLTGRKEREVVVRPEKLRRFRLRERVTPSRGADDV